MIIRNVAASAVFSELPVPVWVGLGVLDIDNPVAVVIEDSRVEQLVLRVMLAAPAVLIE
jgi:hypothetical protein